MTAPYVLARTLKEAHAFAREELGLTVGHYRIVNTSGTLKSVRGVDLYLVPGWNRRYDRFQIQSALRWTKMNVIDAANLEAKEPDTRYADDEKTHTIALRYNALLDLPRDERGFENPDDYFNQVANGDEMLAEGGPAFPVEEPQKISPDDQINDEPTPTTVSDEAKALDEAKPKNRRRSRCKDCGNLHFKGEPCPTEGDES